LPILTLLL